MQRRGKLWWTDWGSIGARVWMLILFSSVVDGAFLSFFLYLCIAAFGAGLL